MDGAEKLRKFKELAWMLFFPRYGHFLLDYTELLFLCYRRPKLCHWGNIATQPSSRTPA